MPWDNIYYMHHDKKNLDDCEGVVFFRWTNIDRLKIYQKKHDNRILKKHIDNYYDYSTLIPLKKYSREQFESKAFAIEYNEYYKYMKKSQERLSLIIDKNIRWEGASGQEICYMRFEKY